MNPREYFRLQLRLEGKEIVNGNLLKQVEVVPGEEVPLMMIVRFANEEPAIYFDEALQADIQRELTSRASDAPSPGIDSLLEFLRQQSISFETEQYKTYLFPARPYQFADVKCFSKSDPLIKDFGFGDFAANVYAVERDGKIVSACVSVRENEKCAEAWVYTDPNYRKQGLAQRVVKVWANKMLKVNKVPFYSHAIHNSASANLARSLGLQPIFEEIVISRTN